MNQPASNWTRLLRLFQPATHTTKFLGLALLLPAMMTACLLVVILSAGPSKSGTSNLEALLLAIGFFILPLIALLLGIAALREPRYPPRAVLWLAATLLVFTGGSLVSFLMFIDPQMEPLTAIVFMLIVILPAALLVSLPAIYSGAKTLPELRATLIAAAGERALAYIAARGMISLAELSMLVDVSQNEIDNLVDELLRSGQLAGMLDTTSGQVFTAAYLAEQQRQLLEWVNLRGNIRIEELARLLKTTPPTVSDWIYQLVQRGQFNGYINWGKGLVYAASARKIGANSQCPECGGALAPAGGQKIICLHCGTEMWEKA